MFSQEGLKIFSIPVSAYNWQQGCRAHWLTDDLFIFNDFDSDSNDYVARVFSVATQEEVKRFPLAVQDSFGLSYFISLNYRRLVTPLCQPSCPKRPLSALNGEIADWTTRLTERATLIKLECSTCFFVTGKQVR